MDMLRECKMSRFHKEAGLFFLSYRKLCEYSKAMPTRICLILGLFFLLCMTVKADEPIIVVLDPGHGGSDLGGEYEDYVEKDMNLIVAKAMKEELEQYDGIKVYLTRETDKEMTLQERCDFAVDVQADFLFCLHFNMSERHTLFGAETWVSAFGEQYSRGYSFASIEISMLEDLGLYSRGIKTRLGDKGNDYYGIIRHSTENNLTCVLIEHCHLDQPNDQPFYDHKDKLEDFGRLDAEAVAKYYGLTSESLGKDYSDYEVPYVPVPTQTMKPDHTAPDVCMIELINQNMTNGEVTISVSAADYDSGMLYYTYSYDGGKNFSELNRWPDKAKDTFQTVIQVPSGIIPQIVVNAYNGYDLYTTSNGLNLPSMHYGDETSQTDRLNGNSETDVDRDLKTGEDAVSIGSDNVFTIENHAVIPDRSDIGQDGQISSLNSFFKICLLIALFVFAITLSVLLILRVQKKNRRRRRRYR